MTKKSCREMWSSPETKLTSLLICLGCVLLPQQPAKAQPWMDRSLTPDARASLLLSNMTLDEKIATVHGVTGPYVGNSSGVSRLGIPGLHLEDGPAGVADGVQGVTALPAPILLAASFDTDLARQYGTTIGVEARGKGVHISLGPMINLVRVPQGGRAFETFGEDPYLTGAMSAQHLRGIQSQQVIACPKHFVCNDQELNRGNENSIVDERTLEEIYMPPFLASIRAGAGSLCAAYNQINGAWSSETPLLKSVLKGAFGFKGLIMCDWGANFGTVSAANNGLDLEMPSDVRFGSPLQTAVQNGSVPAAQLDDMVHRILAAMFRFGIFDNPPSGNTGTTVTTAAHAQFARDVAAQGMVLVKNSGSLLPLNAGALHSIAVSGMAASSAPIWTGAGSAQVYLPYYDAPLAGITRRAGGVSVSYSTGTGSDLSQAVQFAQQADIAIVCVGQQTGEGNDRTNFALPSDQDSLVSQVAAVNPHTIVVIYEGAETLMPWIGQVAAVVVAWYPGQEGANALASVLFGDVNPSGKLPVSFPAAADQIPTSTQSQYPGVNLQVTYSEGLQMGYRWYDSQNVTPLFPFGYGMSYTTFGYNNLSVSPVSASGQVTVGFDLSNTGSRAGAEAPQLYLGFPSGAGEPPKQLKGFKKVNLAPGASAHVTFNLGWEDLARWDSNAHAWTVPQGAFQVLVGASSRDIRLTGSFTVSGSVPISGLANLALFQPVTVSSGSASSLAAVDGDPATAWNSAAGDPQSISVDLGASTSVGRVRLTWDANYARSYQVRISNDNANWTTVYNTTSGGGNIEDLSVSGSGRYVQVYATQSSTGSGYSLKELEVFSGAGNSGGNTNTTATVWVEDSLPAGATPGVDNDSWNWVSSNPTPFSGALANQSSLTNGLHQHYFYGATATLTVHTGDTLSAYVYLDPANPPSEIMLQWNDGTWEHRAYWGANQITYGNAGTNSRRQMGALPSAGQWVQLLVPASQVGLEGSVLNGMAFTLYNGRATWDHAGLAGTAVTNGPPDTTPPTVSITSPANNATVTGSAVTVSATANDNVSVASVQFRLDGVNFGAAQTTAPYQVTWDTTAGGNGTHQWSALATDSSGNQALSTTVNVLVSNSVANTIWVEDALPGGAIPGANGGDGWTWISSNPTPFSGFFAHQSNIGQGLHQHFFMGASTTLSVGNNDVLFAYVYLDPANLPSEVMLQWNDGSSWEHRAFWGADRITYGAYGTNGRRPMGALPAAGQWVQLSVPASLVGLGGSTLNGMAFTLFDGRATWDHAGKSGGSVTNGPPPDTTPPTVAITSPANGAVLSGSATFSANASDNVAVANVQFRLDGQNIGAPDSTAPYSLAFDSSTVANGSHQLSALATDTSGNQALSATVSVTVSNVTQPPPDTTPPTVSITSPTNGAVISGSVTVTANASDNVAVSNVQFRLDAQNIGGPDTSSPYSVVLDASSIGNGTHQLTALATDTSGNQTLSSAITVTVNNATANTVWIDDALPAGAVPGGDGGDGWNWVSSNPAPFAGALAHQSNLGSGLHQHYFMWATGTLTVNLGDTMMAYVYLDANNPPSEIMLQWNDGSNFEHRAFWGADRIAYGVGGTNARRPMGALPPTGRWVQLLVPASQVGLEGKTLIGMAFTLYNGRATWDYTGKTGGGVTNPPPDTTPPSVSITAPANNAAVSGSVNISANASDNVAVGSVQFRVDGQNISGPDTTAPYGVTWDTASVSNGQHQLTALAVDTSGNQATSVAVTVTVSNAVTATIWVDDALPAGAVAAADGGDAWTWVSSNPTPFSGAVAHQSSASAGLHQHYFYGATTVLTVNTGDTLSAYVYLDPANPPSEIMLQWYSDSWNHRAFWGANRIAFGTLGTPSSQFMGPLPPAGQWVKLSIPASAIALEGSTVTGMAFTLYDGRATWDAAGK
jgi:beta-glucosidase